MKRLFILLKWTAIILILVSIYKSIAIFFTNDPINETIPKSTFVIGSIFFIIILAIIAKISHKLAPKFDKDTIPTIGRVISVEETGTTKKRVRRIVLSMMVEIKLNDDRVIVGRAITTCADKLEVARYRPGLRLPVRYKRENPKIINLDYKEIYEQDIFHLNK